MDIWMRLVAACEAFREREGSSAPGVLCNNILMNEKLATRSFERNHWLLSGLCPDHGALGSNGNGAEGRLRQAISARTRPLVRFRSLATPLHYGLNAPATASHASVPATASEPQTIL